MLPLSAIQKLFDSYFDFKIIQTMDVKNVKKNDSSRDPSIGDILLEKMDFSESVRAGSVKL
jgi:hypothetical protein